MFNFRNYCRRSTGGAMRRGFTLVELLVVIIILSIITVATIPVVRPALQGRRMREAARMLSSHISEAQMHAASINRPAGIWIERQRLPLPPTAPPDTPDFVPAAAANVYLCEVPLPYSGAVTGAVAEVKLTQINGTNFYTFQIFTHASAAIAPVPDAAEYGLSANLIRPGDLIQFDHRGPLYPIHQAGNSASAATPNLANVVGDTIYVRLDNNMRPEGIALNTNGLMTAPLKQLDDSNRRVSFQIFRQPVRLSSTPLQLPGSVIDLFYSSIGGQMMYRHANVNMGQYLDNNLNSVDGRLNRQPIVITFRPNGALDKLYMRGEQKSLTQAVHLLVGKPEKTPRAGALPQYNRTEPRETQTEKHNFRDLENLWVSINPHTGIITTAEPAEFRDDVDADMGISGTETPEQVLWKAVRRSKQHVLSGQTMGGG